MRRVARWSLVPILRSLSLSLGTIIALTAAIVSSGCMMVIHTTDPPISAKRTASASSSSLSYGLFFEPAAEYGERHEAKTRDQLARLLSECVREAGYSSAEELPAQDRSMSEVADTLAAQGKPRYLLVRVVHHPFLSGGGGVMLSALTLGIIPAYERQPVFTVQIQRGEPGREPALTSHQIDSKGFYSLVFVPVCWLSLIYTPDEELRKVVREALAGVPGAAR